MAGDGVTREAAAQLRAVLADRFPGAAVSATPEAGGVRVEMSGGGSRLTASIGNRRSSVLGMLLFGAVDPPD
jgi:hypothetical protein